MSTNARHLFASLNRHGVEFVRDNFLESHIIRNYINYVFNNERTFRILDIGCGDFPYLRKNAYSENDNLSKKDNPRELLLPVFESNSGKGHVEIQLIDPNTEETEVPKVWKPFTRLSKCCFHEFLENHECNCEEQRFDLIILSAVAHELYLKWCQSRIMPKVDGEEDVVVSSGSREEFCSDLFRKLSNLLKKGGYVLLVENYCPKRVKYEAQLLAREIQYGLMEPNHADSPAAFFPTEEYVDVAEKLGFKCVSQDSVRCVDITWIIQQKSYQALDAKQKDAVKDALESRRFGCKLIVKNEECPLDASSLNVSQLHRGFLFDMSSVVNVDELDNVLHDWVNRETTSKPINIKTEYRDVFWSQNGPDKKPVFVQLIEKCHDVVERMFSYEVITYPKLFSCWVSINSLVTGGRFSAVDDDGGEERFTPILYENPEGSVVQVYSRKGKLKDWNEIAFNFFSSIQALRGLLNASGLGDDATKIARSPSVYNYMRKASGVRSLTLTYARPASLRRGAKTFADIELATQEDAINALELGHWQSSEESLKMQKHHLIILDFQKMECGEDDADPCLREAEQINTYMAEGGGYYTDVNDKPYVKYLTAIYLDFLFLRRFESENGNINQLIDCFRKRWQMKIRKVFGINGGVGKKFVEMIKDAAEIAKSKMFQMDNLPRAFITFSSPTYLYDDSGEVHTDRKEQPPGSMMIFTDKVFSKDTLDSMVAVTEHTFDVIRAVELKWCVEKRNRELRLSNTKSAIGSIMSRNGSHNIGSHVLAALSHNVGTMPDDRVLYQYIQHRMDYIATVTTDFPTWTQPTMLLGSLMKGFLSQRHLLDHIAESEGLSAWQFQGCKLSDEERKKQHWIEFHVRRKTEDGSYEELIEYPIGSVHLDRDVSLAIPGGAVGHHAFYTILENILRNAAKHDWSVKKNGKGDGERGDLPIYIDFEEKRDDVEIEIWTRLSKLPSGDELPQKLRGLIERPFINDNGQLRRENWGLAEMKISAGYLRRSGIDVIGGLKRDERKLENALILPTAVEKTVPIGEKGENEMGTYLAFRFFIPKPRELLIIANGIDSSDATKSRIDAAEEQGVYVKTWQQILEEGKTNARALELNYRFVVHPAVTNDVMTMSGVKFPFRVLSGAEATGVNGMVPQFTNYGEVVKGLLGGSSNDVKPAVEKALKDVYECWCSHIVKTYRNDIKLDEDGKIGLLITPSEGTHTGGHSLISDADILKYVMRECFKKCVEQYHVLNGANEDNGEAPFYDVFMELCKGPRNIPEDIGKVGVQNDIARLLYGWIGDALDRMASPMKGLAEAIKQDIAKCYSVSAVSGKGDQLHAETTASGTLSRRQQREAKKKRNEALKKESAIKEVERILRESTIGGFIEYIESVHEQVKSLFKQYEENIVSLPDGYRPRKDEGVNSGGGSEIKDLGDIAKVAFNAKLANSTAGVKWIAYRRHDNSLTDNIRFAEPLSGTQSYLTQIVDLVAHLAKEATVSAADYGLCVRLLENGLMRMLVIDERVAKFVREHRAEVGSFYKSVGITVLDDELRSSEDESNKNKEVVEIFNKFIKKHKDNPGNNQSCSSRDASSSFIGASSESLQGKFEILIIHQGILDKWFPNEKNDKKKMSDILEDFKKMVKYVVITTGRGTPSNIPEDAHLIPFAVVEAALFRKYPEKLILVDAVMNVLAIGKHESEGG